MGGFWQRRKKAQLQSDWKAASSSCSRKSEGRKKARHGDRVVTAAAPFRVGLQIPWRCSCSHSPVPARTTSKRRARTKLGGSSSAPGVRIPLPFFTNCSGCCFPAPAFGSWPPSHAKNRRSSCSPASPTALLLVEGFSLAASACFRFLLCFSVESQRSGRR